VEKQLVTKTSTIIIIIIINNNIFLSLMDPRLSHPTPSHKSAALKLNSAYCTLSQCKRMSSNHHAPQRNHMMRHHPTTTDAHDGSCSHCKYHKVPTHNMPTLTVYYFPTQIDKIIGYDAMCYSLNTQHVYTYVGKSPWISPIPPSSLALLSPPQTD
jgi:hypothetical protein